MLFIIETFSSTLPRQFWVSSKYMFVCWARGFMLYIFLLSVVDRFSSSDVINTGASMTYVMLFRAMHILRSGA
jgi:hypothetical protein